MCTAGMRERPSPSLVVGEARRARTRSPLSSSWSQSDALGLSRMPRRPGDDALGHLVHALGRPETSRENASSAFALSASRRWGSYSRAFSSATEAWLASTSSTRRSSASNCSSPSFEITITPVTREAKTSGTASSDSSISAVPAMCCAELVAARVPDEQRLPGLGDAAGDPAPDARGSERRLRARLGRGEPAAEGDRQEVVAVAQEHAAVVVVDEEPELVRDREPDLLHVVEPRELARRGSGASSGARSSGRRRAARPPRRDARARPRRT